jgi:predicted lipoprotein
MMKKNIILVAVGVVMSACIFLASCSDAGESKSDNFDRSALLQNYADNAIIPAYDELLNNIETFADDIDALTDNTSVETLEIAQASWLKAYKSWQHANSFNFGPAGEEGLKKGLSEEIGTFPASVTKIENIISTDVYNLNDVNRDARGFLAIEYILFRLDENQDAIIDSLQNANRLEYLTALANNLQTRVTAVVDAWSGSYRDEFIANNGTDVGSSVTQFYNEFLRSYEALKNFKLAIPLGLGVGQTETLPDNVEAYYSGKSIDLIKLHYTALESIWYGKGLDGEDGLGFKEYLLTVEGGPDLVTTTETQLQEIHTALAAINNTTRLSTQIEAHNPDLVTLHTALQKNTRYFKGDMSSRLGLAITYSSGDGD